MNTLHTIGKAAGLTRELVRHERELLMAGPTTHSYGGHMATLRDRTPADTSTPPAPELTPQVPDETLFQPSQDDIAREAYARFCARGQVHGHDVDDWIESERDLRARGKIGENRDALINRPDLAEV